MQMDDQPVWRFKHPTIGDAYATTLALSPDLLNIFLSGSNLIAQATCGNVGFEKAVVGCRFVIALICNFGKSRSLYSCFSGNFFER